ncbi:MAG: response regulator [Deltaproteobacteria bacterium]|nr:response regulator [Deltaproteobacteria bacterium]
MQKNLLIIDHNDNHYDLLRQSLSESAVKFRVIRAATAEVGRKLLKSRRFDLILTECDDDGGTADAGSSEEWVPLVKRMAHGAPVVVLTSKSDQKRAVSAMKMGADDYIVKSREALKSLPQTLVKTIESKKTKPPATEGPTPFSGINLLARNLKTITTLINNPSQGWAQSKKHFKQLHVIEKEIRNIKDMLKNFVS